VVDLIGTLDVEERARGKILSHLLPTWYKKGIFMHLVISRIRTRENKFTIPSQNRPLSSRRKTTRKRMKDALFAGEHWASACPRKFVKEKKSANIVINEIGGGTSGYGYTLPYVLSIFKSHKWWMDSGANIHVCADISLFVSFQQDWSLTDGEQIACTCSWCWFCHSEAYFAKDVAIEARATCPLDKEESC
jgi:hypothetical protein